MATGLVSLQTPHVAVSRVSGRALVARGNPPPHHPANPRPFRSPSRRGSPGPHHLPLCAVCPPQRRPCAQSLKTPGAWTSHKPPIPPPQTAGPPATPPLTGFFLSLSFAANSSLLGGGGGKCFLAWKGGGGGTLEG